MTPIFFLVGILVLAAIGYGLIAGLHKPKASRRGNGRGVDRALVAERWQVIQTSASVPGSGLKQAVSEADKLLDYALKQLNYPGETMADRLKKAESRLSNHNAVWRAHKLRNMIAHEVGFEFSASEGQEALASFERALRDLGAL